MTPEQRERARRLIETVAEHAESDARYYAGPNGSDLDAPGNRRMAEKYAADADALRAVLEMLDAEPVGYAHVHRMPDPDESGLRVWVPDQYAEDSAETASARCRGHFPVVALLPVRKGGES